ncbi:unnamed protein product [Dovyalis caffra]|uniref:Uncharacterized protein n=1 Tax=Dovyalis caffra TaxID=77055 RepID=A0AAV1RST4_9ROSI|nr:unnamed protein product [Dovyalis caffra]
MSLDDPLLALADAASKEHSSPGTNPWVLGSYTQKPKRKGKADAFSADQCAPVTPDKGKKVESKKITEMQNLCTYARRNQNTTADTDEEKAQAKVHQRRQTQRVTKISNLKSAASTENPTGKRKYVPKTALNKASTSTPAGANGWFTNPKTIEPAKKSCRRALNFDIERQFPDEALNSG